MSVVNSNLDQGLQRSVLSGVQRLFLSSGLVIGARMGGVLAGLMLQLALARLLGAADLGVFFMITSATLVCAVICTQGYPLMIARFAASEHEESTSGLLAAFMKHAVSSVALATAVVCIGVLTWASLSPSLETEQRTWLAMGALSVPVLVALRINGALANALRRFSLGYVPDLLLRPVLLLCFVGGVWLLDVPFSLVTLLTAQLLIAALIAAWQYVKVWKDMPFARNATAAERDLPGESIRSWRFQALKLLPALVFVSVFADMTILVAGTYLGSKGLGVFGVCLKISMIPAFVVYSVQQICSRDLADAIHRDNAVELKSTLLRANILGVSAAVCGLVATLAVGDIFLGLYGQDFSSAYWCLNLLMISQVVRATAGPGVQMLPLIGQEGIAIQAFGLGLLALVVISFFLIPLYGLSGAAVSVMVSTCVWAIWQTIQIYRKSGILIALDVRQIHEHNSH